MKELEQAKEYVAGFLFSSDLIRVALIRKNKPDWQAGKLNAIGGKIELGETPEEAMIREFKEETDLYIERWSKFCVLSDKRGWNVHFFYKTMPSSILYSARNMTDEEILVVITNGLKAWDRMENLDWLIPMAIEACMNTREWIYYIQEK
jgi:8-oxo-dGTP diphosphatase